jgi:hypothetical protein
VSGDEALLEWLQAEYPRWTVGPSDADPVWQAVTRPTPASLHVLIGRTLPELGARLARAAQASGSDTGPGHAG